MHLVICGTGKLHIKKVIRAFGLGQDQRAPVHVLKADLTT